MIYQTYYSGTDRSMFEQAEIDSGTAQGQVREPTSLQAINHFIYSLRYKTPSLVIYYPNSEYDQILRFKRDDEGKNLFKHYISICLLYRAVRKYKSNKKGIETEIYQKMLAFITEEVNNRNSKVQRIDKDFPIEPACTILKDNDEEFIRFVVDYINGDAKFNEKFNITQWNYKSFLPWQHRYGKTRLLALLQKSRIPTFSYLKWATKAGFVLDTPKLINLLDANCSADRGKFIQKLNPQDTDTNNSYSDVSKER